MTRTMLATGLHPTPARLPAYQGREATSPVLILHALIILRRAHAPHNAYSERRRPTRGTPG
jgi:hypothetical protein